MNLLQKIDLVCKNVQNILRHRNGVNLAHLYQQNTINFDHDLHEKRQIYKQIRLKLDQEVKDSAKLVKSSLTSEPKFYRNVILFFGYDGKYFSHM